MATTVWIRAVIPTSIKTNTTLVGKCCCKNFRGGPGSLFSRLGKRQSWKVFLICHPSSSKELNPALPHAKMAETNQAQSPLVGQEGVLSEGNFTASGRYYDKWQGLSNVASQHLGRNAVTFSLGLCPDLFANPWCLLLSLWFLLLLFSTLPKRGFWRVLISELAIISDSTSCPNMLETILH